MNNEFSYDELEMHVRRLEAYAKNLVILYNEGIEDSKIEAHVRLIAEYIRWFDHILPLVSGDQKTILETTRKALESKNPHFQEALDLLDL